MAPALRQTSLGSSEYTQYTLTPTKIDGCPNLRNPAELYCKGGCGCPEYTAFTGIEGAVIQLFCGRAWIWASGGRGMSGVDMYGQDLFMSGEVFGGLLCYRSISF